MSTPIAYLNGSFIPESAARLPVSDLGIVGGMSVTEMVRTFRHQPFRLDEHLARLMTSLDYVGFPISLDMEGLRRVCDEVVATNAALIPDHHDLGLIVFVTAGLNRTYLGRAAAQAGSTVCVHTFPLPFELWSDLYDTGLHLVTVPTRGIPDEVIDPRVKHRSRLHWHLASREAHQVDPAAMAILTDLDGNLTETATGNLCAVDGTTIVTPAAHVLEGVSREFLVELAGSLGLSVVHAALTPGDLAHADEAFLTSTPHCLLPVTQFNCSPIGSGKPGPVFQKLIEAWSQVVKVNIREQMRQGAADRAEASCMS
jgi:branched-chain amino acid aminotransferase